MGSLKIEIKTLTPIWTGDVNRNCSEIKETGIIGSMRWWYEAIVRGMGGYACDPNSKERCQLSGKEKTDEERKTKMCPACYIFGCTGWKRRFNLKIVNNGILIPVQFITLEKEGKFNNWWLSQIFEKSLGTNLPFGKVILYFEPFHGTGNEEIIKQLKALLSMMANCGAIGAKNQYGFGRFDWIEKKEIKDALVIIQKFLNQNTTFINGLNKKLWYSFDKFWLYNIRISRDNKLLKKFLNANLIGNGSYPNDYLPISFDIRYKLPYSGSGFGLRQAYYEKHKDKYQTRLTFGTLKNDKIGSRVFVSHLFKLEKDSGDFWLRVWGFTEENIGKEIGEELKNIFMHEKIPEMVSLNIIIEHLQGEKQ